ncbi:F0F1 ATP synthase subunit B [Mycobacterium intermedium]|uniref:ATP synthase subunit b n=1 Tax=Mycobacterium intermedium TaxID=28445 RepID=A0A1E3SGW0_MYCIE|nr:F0F1 ATP synthase subunit B [Mycobacterium intermedium]ODR01335.1 F0F1 ATP synthase subunit B [Mycobacterium intermedium]OPE52566.1 F0F1 ATP synthase subunit B [Mycobacterium intermedium]ORB07447.1 F0F1 ATP synthase subunit B [Mycobacterium intermedium]
MGPEGEVRLLASAVDVVAEGQKNFLIPDATFFFVLAIFLIVLGVISTWVVPPILRVLREREAIVAKTISDNKKASEQFAAAESDYEEAMKEARAQAGTFRDNARIEGRKVIEQARSRAEQEVAATLATANEQLKRERDSVEMDLRANVGTMSATLASRILGVDVTPSATTR